jgi:mono/diheme cytochrome c family protein
MLRPFLLLSAAVVLAFASGPSLQNPAPQAPNTHKPSSTAPISEAQARAKKIYQRDCAMCHGDDGAGQTSMVTDMHLKIPDWSDPKTLSAKSDQELLGIIRKGTSTMPLETEDRASDEEVRNLVSYIRTFAVTRQDTATK